MICFYCRRPIPAADQCLLTGDGPLCDECGTRLSREARLIGRRIGTPEGPADQPAPPEDDDATPLERTPLDDDREYGDPVAHEGTTDEF